jgi:Cupin-like domain
MSSRASQTALYHTSFVLDQLFGRMSALDPAREGFFFRQKRRAFESFQRRLENHPVQEASPLPILESDEATPERFQQLSEKMTRPVVIRGYIRDSQACQDWSPEYFIAHLGDDRIPVVVRGDKNLEHTRKHGEMRLVTMREYLSDVQQGGTAYVNNLTRIFVTRPELLREMELHRLRVLYPASAQRIFNINLFMGGRGTGSSLHCAFNGNFFHNIKGRKRWVFYAPSASPYLLPTGAHPFLYAISDLNYREAPSDSVLRKLPRYEVELEPGDLLYNAPWWWHDVENLSDFTVACAARCHLIWQNYTNNLTFTLSSAYPFHVLMHYAGRYFSRMNALQRMQAAHAMVDKRVYHYIGGRKI